MVGLFPSIMLVVKNIEQSLVFYRDQLGMNLFDIDEWDGHKVAYLTLKEFTLVLFQQPEHEQKQSFSLPGQRGDGVLLSLQVGSVQRLAADLKKGGTQILRDISHAPWGEQTLMVTDPDGYAVLLGEPNAMSA